MCCNWCLPSSFRWTFYSLEIKHSETNIDALSQMPVKSFHRRRGHFFLAGGGYCAPLWTRFQLYDQLRYKSHPSDSPIGFPFFALLFRRWRLQILCNVFWSIWRSVGREKSRNHWEKLSCFVIQTCWNLSSEFDITWTNSNRLGPVDSV